MLNIEQNVQRGECVYISDGCIKFEGSLYISGKVSSNVFFCFSTVLMIVSKNNQEWFLE